MASDVYFVKDDKLGVGSLTSGTDKVTALAASTVIRYRGPTLDAPWGLGDSIKSGGLVVGERYIIQARSLLDFTTIGSADNNVNTKFIATGSLTMTSVDYVATFREEAQEPFFPDRFHMAIVAYILMRSFPIIKVKKIDRDGNTVDVIGDFVAARYWESQWNKYVKNGQKFSNLKRLRRDFAGAGPEIMDPGLD